MISGVVSANISNQQAEADLEQKINEKMNKAYEVSGINDRSLFDWYSGNKLHHMIFEPDEDNKKLIQKYFDLFGYSRGYYEKPNVNSRYFYNYVRGDVELDGKDYQPFFRYRDLIANKFKDGVYYIHNRVATYDVWDTDLSKENVEVALLPESWIQDAKGYEPFSENSLTDLEMDDREGFSCRYVGDPRTIDNNRYYVEFEWYQRGDPAITRDRPDETGSTLGQSRRYNTGDIISILA